MNGGEPSWLLVFVGWTVVAPAAVAALVAAASTARDRAAGWALPLALGLGYLVAHAGATGLPSWPPIDTTQGLFLLMLPALIIGLAEGRGRPTASAARWASRLLVVASCLWFTLRPMLQYHWHGVVRIAAPVALSVVVLALWSGSERIASRLSASWASSAVWLVAVTATAASLALSSTALMAQLAAAAACALLGATCVARWRSGVWQPPVLALLVPLEAALALNGAFYADIPLPWALLLVLSPLGAGLALGVDTAALGSRRRALSAVGATALVALPALVASWLGWVSRAAEAAAWGY
jgi:hypothetical protein